jgi:hypothetical protein
MPNEPSKSAGSWLEPAPEWIIQEMRKRLGEIELLLSLLRHHQREKADERLG